MSAEPPVILSAIASQKPFECTTGWITHYTIGVVFAVVFIMQPSFGLGIAASRTSNPPLSRLKSLGTHAAFGLGLYASVIGVRYVLQLHF